MVKRIKQKTWQQAEAMQAKAVRFLRDVIGDDQKADEIEELTVSEYATRKGLVLNPLSKLNKPERSKTTMANESSTITKADLENENGELLDLLNDIWAELADVGNTTNKAQAIEAIDSVCELMNDFDPETFPMEGAEAENSDDEIEEEVA